MTNKIRNVTKQLLGAEDVLFGRGTVNQRRGPADVSIHRLDLALPVADEAELAITDPEKYPKASIGSRNFVAVNGQYQEVSTIQPVLFSVGAMMSAEYPYAVDGDTVAKWTGAFPKTLTLADQGFTNPGWQVTSTGLGRAIISETVPSASFTREGVRWYKPSESTTYVYYCDGDSCQWVQEPVQSAEGTLRQELAASDSNVLVGGVKAEDLSRKYGQIVFVTDFGAVSDGVTDDTAAVQAAADSFSVFGGTLVFPIGTTKITTLTLTNPVDLVGFGFKSIVDATTINFPTVSSVKNSVKNIRLNGNGNNTLLNITKVWTSQSSPSFILDNVWLHNNDGTGTLLKVYGARESSISKCWFSSSLTNYDSATRGILFEGDDIGGAMNIDVSSCQFVFLDQAIDVIGSSANYQFLAGIRIINNMFIGLLGGIDIAFADYIQIEQNMMDFVNKPIVSDFCPNLKIRNNYFAAREAFNDAIAITNNKSEEMQWLEISKNRIFTYETTNRGNGIVINANGGDIVYGDISDNDMDLLANCIILQGAAGGRTFNMKVKDNQARSSGAFLLLNAGAELNDIEMNYAEANVSAFIVDNNPAGENKYNIGNRYGTKRSSNKGKIIASGNGSQVVFSAPHNLFQAPSNGMATLGANGIAAIPYAVYYDATNIFIEFNSAPIAGTNNVIINWSAEI